MGHPEQNENKFRFSGMKLGNVLAFNDYLVSKLEKILVQRGIDYVESPSFGQMSFLVNGKFLIAVKGDFLELNIGKENVEKIMSDSRYAPNISGASTERGFIVLDPGRFKNDNQLDSWVSVAIKYNRRTAGRKARLQLAY